MNTAEQNIPFARAFTILSSTVWFSSFSVSCCSSDIWSFSIKLYHENIVTSCKHQEGSSFVREVWHKKTVFLSHVGSRNITSWRHLIWTFPFLSECSQGWMHIPCCKKLFKNHVTENFNIMRCAIIRRRLLHLAIFPAWRPTLSIQVESLSAEATRRVWLWDYARDHSSRCSDTTIGCSDYWLPSITLPLYSYKVRVVGK